jgi:cell fate (sporulation/competence/biofilm development) regulator YlbF (YheA/YmcA/DUF963 family)
MKSVAQAQPKVIDKDDAGWRKFPEFEAILGSEEAPALLTKVEKTCKQLNNVLQSGSEADKARARKAMTAYGRSLDLLRALTEMRDKAALATSASKTR